MKFKDKYGASNPANRVRPGLKFVFSHPAHAIALFFGAGCIRPAPGTWGTLAGVLAWMGFYRFFPWEILLGLIVATLFLGVWASEKTGIDLGVADAGCIVIDEVVAVWIVCLMLPQTWAGWLSAFVAFRVFDIVKLPPASIIDSRMHNGWGVMIDDLFAALWALAALLSIEWVAARAGVSYLGVLS